jgi:hypothetical protein
MKELFFKEENENIRTKVFKSFCKIFENCFPNNKKLILEPLLEEIMPNRDRAIR